MAAITNLTVCSYRSQIDYDYSESINVTGELSASCEYTVTAINGGIITRNGVAIATFNAYLSGDVLLWNPSNIACADAADVSASLVALETQLETDLAALKTT
jgi:hypothetical protein